MIDQTKEAWAPGPWEAFANEFTPDFSVRHRRRFICSVTAQQEPMGSANAHLIAAAPDLYEALNKIVEANAAYMADCPLNEPDLITEACEQARKVLAKARGERL